MAPVIPELDGLRVQVDDVVFCPTLEAPAEEPFPFVYFITVKNQSKHTVVLKGRKWVVRQSDGTCRVVEGDGIVGSQPRLEPDDSFSYNSYHTIASDSVAEGAVFGELEDGTRVAARIPRFKMKVPQLA